MKLKLFCLLISVVFALSGISFVYADSVGESNISPIEDAWIGRGSAAPVFTSANTDGGQDFVRLVDNVQYHDAPAWSNAAIGAFAYDISNVFETLEANPEYVVESVVFKPTQNSKYGAVSDLKLHFYPINIKWSEIEKEGYTEFTSANKNIIFNLDTTYTDGPKFLDEPLLTIDEPSGEINDEYDITSLFKTHLKNNKNTDAEKFFSFALTMTNSSSGHKERDIKTIESGDGAEIVVTYMIPEPLWVEEVCTPESPEDYLLIYTNNELGEVTAKVNGENVNDCIFTDGCSVVLDYPFEKNTTYTVSVELTDIYGDSTFVTKTFSTTHNTESFDCVPSDSVHIGSGETDITSYFEPIGGSGYGNGVVIYGFDVPDVQDNSYIEKTTFKFWVRSVGLDMSVHKFAGNPETEDLTLQSESVQMALNDKSEYITESAVETGNVCAVSSYNWYEYEVDITEYVNSLIMSDNAPQKAYVMVACQSTTRLAGSEYNEGLKYLFSFVKNTDPTIYATDKSIGIRGAKLEYLSFVLTSIFEKEEFLNSIVLRTQDEVIEDAVFNYNPFTSKVYLDCEETLFLNPGTVYQLVLCEGLSDVYSNSLSDEIIVTEFMVKSNFEISAPKIVSEDDEVNADNFDDVESLNIPGGYVKAVAVATNYDYTGERVANIIIATFSENTLESINITPVAVLAGETVFLSTSAVDSDGSSKIKAFVWNDFATELVDPLTEFTEVNEPSY